MQIALEFGEYQEAMAQVESLALSSGLTREFCKVNMEARIGLELRKFQEVISQVVESSEGASRTISDHQAETAARIALEIRKYQEALAQVEKIELEVARYQEALAQVEKVKHKVDGYLRAVAQLELEGRTKVSPEWADPLNGLFRVVGEWREYRQIIARALREPNGSWISRVCRDLRKSKSLIETELRRRRISPPSLPRHDYVGFRPWLLRRMCYELDDGDDSVSSDCEIKNKESLHKRKQDEFNKQEQVRKKVLHHSRFEVPTLAAAGHRCRGLRSRQARAWRRARRRTPASAHGRMGHAPIRPPSRIILSPCNVDR